MTQTEPTRLPSRLSRKPRPSTKARLRLRSPSTTAPITRRTRRSISDADYDALAPAQRGDRGALSRSRQRGSRLTQQVGAAPSGIRQGAPRRADAVARQRFRRRGGRRFRRARAPLSGSRDGDGSSNSPPSRRSTACPARCATSTASWSGGDPRRRLRGRERHRQCPHHRGHPASAEGPGVPEVSRSAAKST